MGITFQGQWTADFERGSLRERRRQQREMKRAHGRMRGMEVWSPEGVERENGGGRETLQRVYRASKGSFLL